jgi:hypothetical protein
MLELISLSSLPLFMNLLRPCFKAWDKLYANRYANVNLNVILASIPGIVAAREVSDYLQDTDVSNTLNAVASGAADWFVYLPLHLWLHYASNRDAFMKKSIPSTLDHKLFWKDAAHVYATQIPSITLFYTLAGPAQKMLLDCGFDGRDATVYSYGGVLVLTRAVHTAILYAGDRKKTNCEIP